MKTSSQENTSGNAEVKTAELVLLLDGLRIDPGVLTQTRELLGETANTAAPLNEGVRARIRMRNNPETVRSMMRSLTLGVS